MKLFVAAVADGTTVRNLQDSGCGLRIGGFEALRDEGAILLERYLLLDLGLWTNLEHTSARIQDESSTSVPIGDCAGLWTACQKSHVRPSWESQVTLCYGHVDGVNKQGVVADRTRHLGDSLRPPSFDGHTCCSSLLPKPCLGPRRVTRKCSPSPVSLALWYCNHSLTNTSRCRMQAAEAQGESLGSPFAV